MRTFVSLHLVEACAFGLSLTSDASGIFYGIGTYIITGGTGKFKQARGFGVFIGLANFDGVPITVS